MTDHTGPSPHLHRAVGRVAGRTLRGNRVVNAGLSAGSHVFSTVGRIFHALFLEAMGVFFIFFALAGGFATYRAWQGYSAGTFGIERVVLGVAFTAMFGYFAATSFWRAHRRQRVKEAE